MSLLQAEMTRFYENMRPRFSNPTFASTNIGSSLGMSVPVGLRSSQVSQMQQQVPSSRQSRQEGNDNSYRPLANQRKSISHLSNYGSNSLTSLNRYISDKQVYDKQQKKYNIINVQPKQYEDTIKIYPKYRLENIDQNYYKKMKIEEQIAARNNYRREKYSHPAQIHYLSNQSNPESKQPIRGKYLNNVDEVKDVL